MSSSSSDREYAREIAETFIRQLQNSPAEADKIAGDIHAGEPVQFNEVGGSRHFWKVPLIRPSSNEHIGWTDINPDQSQSIARYGFIQSQASDLLSMKANDIVAQAKSVAGQEASLIGPPEPVFLGAPSKTAWKCRMRQSDGTQIDVLVTPGFARKLSNIQDNTHE